MANNSHKRKRESLDHPATNIPPPPTTEYTTLSPSHPNFESQYLQHPGEGDMTLAEALAQHNAANDHDTHVSVTNGQSATDTANAALHYSMTVPQSTEEAFLQQTTNQQNDEQTSAAFEIETSDPSGQATNFAEYTNIETTPTAQTQPTASRPIQQDSADDSPTSGSKPQVGTDEWHKQRRDNHKEVERRRRETINEGINELSKIVPGCEKNKGRILTQAVAFISQLKVNEEQNIQKWTLEKMLTEQALQELSVANDKMRKDLRDSLRELESWRTAARKVGLEPTREDRDEAERLVPTD